MKSRGFDGLKKGRGGRNLLSAHRRSARRPRFYSPGSGAGLPCGDPFQRSRRKTDADYSPKGGDPNQGKALNLIRVADTTRALQDLAAYYLSLFSIIKIGVTGSTGKTSTKEMLYWIFSEKYKTAGI